VIPVSSLDSVRVQWLKIKQRGFVLHGFLLYTSADYHLPEYISGDGLTDLEQWTGDRCGIFLLHNPPPDWVAYARESDHIWWRAYGEAAMKDGLLEDPLADVQFLDLGDHSRVSPRQLMSVAENKGLAKRQVAAVLNFFELQSTDHPCIVLFRDLHDHDFWFVGLSDLLGLPVAQLRQALKSWFGGTEFRQLLRV
jgi:hypothetical protein